MVTVIRITIPMNMDGIPFIIISGCQTPVLKQIVEASTIFQRHSHIAYAARTNNPKILKGSNTLFTQPTPF